MRATFMCVGFGESAITLLMNETLQALALGVIQGGTEFLPVSSSAHLTLARVLLGWPVQGLWLDIALHGGTLLAVVVVFARTLAQMVCELGTPTQALRGEGLLPRVGVATLPAVLAGLWLYDVVDVGAGRTTLAMGLALVFSGVVLGLVDRHRPTVTRDWASLPLWGCLLVGSVQALALMPGVSRAGMVMCACLLLGVRRQGAAEMAMVLGIPAICGALVLSLLRTPLAAMDGVQLVVGMGAACVTAMVVMAALLSWLRRAGFMVFAVYLCVLGSTVLALN